MAQITRSKSSTILSKLDGTIFTSSAFSIDFPDSGDVLVEIMFLENEEYYFSVETAPIYRDHNFEVKYSPGALFKSEVGKCKEYEECEEILERWLRLLREELRASNHIYNEIDDLKRQFNERLDEKLSSANSGSFTNEEIKQMGDKFADLYAEIESLKEQNSITESELIRIQNDLADLKSSMTDMPKKTWYRSAGSKLIDISTKIMGSKVGQKVIEQATDRLLGPPQS